MRKKTIAYVLRGGMLLCALILALLLGDDRLLEYVLQVDGESAAAMQEPTGVAATNTSAVYGVVTRVVDGDTLVFMDAQQQEIKVRLLGVDAPESVHPTKPVECFGKEASLFLKGLIERKQVRIETDASQGVVDRYGRTLAYVFLDDGTNVNERLLSGGYAHEYTYGDAYVYQTAFKNAEVTAQTEGRGLWADGVCSEK